MAKGNETGKGVSSTLGMVIEDDGSSLSEVFHDEIGWLAQHCGGAATK
jgi:hypothetical protein